MEAIKNWLELPEEQQKRYISTIGIESGISAETVEKDWWVTLVLRALFASSFAEHISFKGGTSLSKCWNLIERISEDVDIAINREFLGFGGELSKTQISDKLRRVSCSFVRETMQSELEKQIENLGVQPSLFEVKVDITPITTTDPEKIEVHYRSLLPLSTYVLNKVIIEVSGRSMNEPLEEVKINSIISQSIPNAKFADELFSIKAVSPKRTFLEKSFLLHEEFAKAIREIRIDRMSRHIYDLEKLMDTPFVQEALMDKELYKTIVEHRRKFIGIKGFDYDTLAPQTISFVPPNEVIPYWKDDYTRMQHTMIYGESLSFDKLIERIKELNERFREIKIE
jgi:predicted nucleotidyltransferase component of viral defense system